MHRSSLHSFSLSLSLSLCTASLQRAGMEVAGLVVGVIPLVTMANDLYNSIQRLRCNPQRKQSLIELAKKLQDIVGTASARSSAAEELVRTSLEDVKSALESLGSDSRNKGPLRKFIPRGRAALREADMLDEVAGKLKSLTTQVVVVKSIFQLREQLPRVCNEKAELPECPAGLNRAESVRDFLQKNVGEKLRVVGIYGMPGLGKSTLLNCIWNDAPSTAPFAKRAHIQVGQSVDDSQICKLQSIILHQLGGETSAQFTASAFGREKLREHLQQLKVDKMPIFLAIDNVFDVEHLENLLPVTLSEHAPASSVIALTSRSLAVVKALLNICSLPEKNASQVYLLNPNLLEPAESKAVFTACGGLSNDTDAELVESLVPLCGGLPLALTVLGKLFAGNARRSRGEWERIKRQMEELHGDNTLTRRVTNALQVSYDQLGEKCKAAFVEVVNCFYGWQWETVERILDVDVLADLNESSLIFEVDHWSKCNQSALREGFDMRKNLVIDKRRGVVTMHDLILKFGEGLCTDHSVMETADSQSISSMRDCLQHLEARKVRNLILRKGRDEGDSELHDRFLKEAENVKSLFLSGIYEYETKFLLKASVYTNNVRIEKDNDLRFLRLEGWKSSKTVMEMKLSSGIREIHLYRCQDVEQFPDISLHDLEVLIIHKCENFQYLAPSHVEKWCKLRMLWVVDCDRFTSVPAELGRLESLSDLRIERCSGLQTLPTMSNCPLQRLHLGRLPIANLNLKGMACSHLQHLVLQHCISFEELSVDGVQKLAALTELDVEGCSSLKALPPAIGNGSSLRTLRLQDCESLVELPEEVGKLAALTELDVEGCRSLKALPPAIGNASSLRMLRLRWCESLVELPEEVGKLVALTELDVGGCRSLKALPLAIGKASSLRTLRLRFCESLAELPKEVGMLAALTELDVGGCRSLKALPPAITNASSLRSLLLWGCENLMKLPEEVGKLVALTELDVGGCRSLKVLPPTIGNASSLRSLRLVGCESLVELPEEVGKLAALTELDAGGCRSLKVLSSAIGNASSLRSLRLAGCESLEKLPEEVGNLVALIELDVEGCRSLKGLPSAIRNCSSLRSLRLAGCESVVELFEEVGELWALNEVSMRTRSFVECSFASKTNSSFPPSHLAGCESLVGKLTALTELNIQGCRSLKALPSAIGNSFSLRSLRLRGCESLKELPEEVGKLTVLTELDVGGCRSLKVLPPAIGSISSLRSLCLTGCESLVELPEEVGKLTELKELDVRGCRSLKALPPAIGNASSLRSLRLAGCDSLVELPKEVGKLTALTELDVRGCGNLKALPPTIGNTSLRSLCLAGCDSLVELPEEVEKLVVLTEVDVGGCKSLTVLPPAIGNASSL